MRLSSTLPIFALLLLVSTATSFLGYRYLSLAGEYRERNFNHLSETQGLLDLLTRRPILDQIDLQTAMSHVRRAQTQSLWCIENLSAVEKRVFMFLGAANALDICKADVETSARALQLLQAYPPRDFDMSVGEKSPFAVGLLVKDIAFEMQRDSLAFQPYVSVIDAKLTRIVIVGTLVTAIGLGVIFLLLSRELLRAFDVQKRQTAELIELAQIAENATNAILVTDKQEQIVWANPAFESLSGYDLTDVAGLVPGSFLNGKDTNPQTVSEMKKAVSDAEIIKREILNYKKTGEAFWIAQTVFPLLSDDGSISGFVSMSDDITKERAQREAIAKAKQEIEYQAMHDPLTDLLNRRALDAELMRMGQSDDPVTIIRIDLDHFKYVNDTLGHAAGDYVLQAVGRILREETKAPDLPVRVGGDEFVLLLAENPTSEQARTIALRLLERISEPIHFEEKTARVGASFGVASTEDGLLAVDELIIGADAALYEAKELGRNQVRLYTPQLHKTMHDRRMLARELKKAVALQEFEPFFHPQVDANSREIIGFEVLARWRSDALGFLLPDRFIPVAERLSLVEDIDDIIFKKALLQMNELCEAGVLIDKLSFNVTAQRIQNPKILSLIEGLSPSGFKIAFEVLESVLVEEQGDVFQYGVDRLREAGIGIEVDDFGSGHASIIGLMQLRPDAMKIDQRLIRFIDTDVLSQQVIKNIIGIASAMDLTVIAEGVETQEHAEILTQLGCHVLQGYAFGKPMAAGDLKSFCRLYTSQLSQTSDTGT